MRHFTAGDIIIPPFKLILYTARSGRVYQNKENLEKAGYTSLYDVNKQDEIRKFQQLLETNKDFIALNHTSNNQYSASVYNYVKFIDFLFVFGRKK